MYVCLTQSAGIILYKMSEKSLLAQWTNAGQKLLNTRKFDLPRASVEFNPGYFTSHINFTRVHVRVPDINVNHQSELCLHHNLILLRT